MFYSDPSFGTPRVLHVEDQPDIREHLAFSLRRFGISVTGAGTIREARLALAAAKAMFLPYHVIVTDGDLPDGNGADLAVELDSQGMDVLIFSSDTGNRRGSIPFLLKPASVETQSDFIRDLILKSAAWTTAPAPATPTPPTEGGKQ